ncbi:hypothetical protein [Streptomyces sp. NPDC048277]|uniref:hypothetical protein n=1 Tax=Streptomyces sp. NPDC048277 TaxID=3155027 RepID=UPI0033D36D34
MPGNWALAEALPTWNTGTSPVVIADLDIAMGCDSTAATCATAYDGLHPDPLGEYRLAGAFSSVLHERLGVGSAALTVPAGVPDRSSATPTDLKFDGTQQGVTVTWPKVFGAHGYDVQWREVTDGGTSDWTDSSPGAEANRWDLGRQFTNQPYDGHRYEVRVRAAAGDLKSPWSDPVSGIAHPTGALPHHRLPGLGTHRPCRRAHPGPPLPGVHGHLERGRRGQTTHRRHRRTELTAMTRKVPTPG